MTVVNGFAVVVAWIGGSEAIIQFNINQAVVLIRDEHVITKYVELNFNRKDQRFSTRTTVLLEI